MQHPLRNEKLKPLCDLLVTFIRTGLNIQKRSSILFVCGNNDPKGMRKQFKALCNAQSYHYFEPESAITHYREISEDAAFNIALFEDVIAELSHSVILFPEGPGSFAETGYFSGEAKNSLKKKHSSEIIKKILLAVNVACLKSDSFLSIGPIQLIDKNSLFSPYIPFNYDKPDFQIIFKRLSERKPLTSEKQPLELTTFKTATGFEKFALVQFIISMLRIATIEDIEYFIYKIFNLNANFLKKPDIRKYISILIGANYIKKSPLSEYGHWQCTSIEEYPLLLTPKKLFLNRETKLREEIFAEIEKNNEFFSYINEGLK